MVEHVLGRFAEIDDPLGQRRRLDAVRHVLRVDRAGRVVVAADAADAAGDEVRVARVLALHEDAVAAKDRRGAVALGDLAVVEVDLGVDAEAADDPGDRIPVHLDQLAALIRAGRCGSARLCDVGHDRLLVRSADAAVLWDDSRSSASGPLCRHFGSLLSVLLRELAQRADHRAVDA